MAATMNTSRRQRIAPGSAAVEQHDDERHSDRCGRASAMLGSELSDSNGERLGQGPGFMRVVDRLRQLAG